MKLTEHFDLSEFTRSATADRLHIGNTIPEELIPNLRNLCEKVLEPLRRYANEPVIISSGYRCPELNRLVGGSINSQHLKGEAADIYCEEGIRLRQWYTWLLDNTRFDQLIFETKGSTHWIHVSLCLDDSRNRQHALRIAK